MDSVRKGLGLALASSVAWSFWTVLIDVVDGMGKSNYIAYLTIVELFVIALNLAFLRFYKTKATRPPRLHGARGITRYPVYAGLCFGVGNIIFYALVGGKDYPFVASMMFSSVVILALLLGRITKRRIGALYVVGTMITFAGLVAQAVVLYGTDLALAAGIIIYSAAMSLSYALGYYFAIYYAYEGIDPVRTLPQVYVPILATAILFGIATGGYSGLAMITPEEVLICLLIAVAVIVGYLTEEFAFAALRGAKTKYLNIANILTNLEIVGAGVFTAFFLHLAYQWLLAGLALTFIGILVIERSKD